MTPLAEAVVRIVGAFILLNIFSLGLWSIVRGRKTQLKLRRLRRVDGKLSTVGRLFQATVSWRYLGEEHLGTDPSLYAFTKRESIPLRISRGGDYYLDIWTHNGKGQMILGIFLCLSAVSLAFILI